MRFAIVGVCLAFGLLHNGDDVHGAKNYVTFGKDGQFSFERDESNYIQWSKTTAIAYGMDTKNFKSVIVKIEFNTDTPSIPNEAEVYKAIGHHRGIPYFFYVGQLEDNTHVLVHQQVRTMRSVWITYGPRFSVKTICMLGIQLMYRIEYIHSKRFVHRDISWANTAVGQSGMLIYIHNFGKSEKYVDANGFHVKEGPSIEQGSGYREYMSIYAHTHDIQSRRDDMESIGYYLMRFLTGSLPWSKFGITQPETAAMKSNLKYEEFFKEYPKQFMEYMEYVRKLKFEERPDYAMLRKKFRDVLGKTEDFRFDWIVRGF